MGEVYANPDCERCSGSGYYFITAGAVLCKCGGQEEIKAILADSGIEKRFKDAQFTNYHPVTETQLEARRAILNWTTTFDTSSLGIWLDGDVGTGKTHLASAVVNALAEKRKVRSKFYTVPSFLMALRNSISNSDDGTELELIEEATTVPLLILDDIGAERMTDYALEKLYIVLDQRYQAALPVIVTTNLSVDGLREHIGLRLVSRLAQMTKHMTIDGPDYRTAVPTQNKITQEIANAQK